MPSRFLGVSMPSRNMEFPRPLLEFADDLCIFVNIIVCFRFLYKMVGKKTHSCSLMAKFILMIFYILICLAKSATEMYLFLKVKRFITER